MLVHGGGPEINSWLGKLGIESKFKNGLRVTDGKCGKILPCDLRVQKDLCRLPRAVKHRYSFLICFVT